MTWVAVLVLGAVRAAPAREPDRMVLSDGRSLTGEVFSAGDAPLRVFDTGAKKFRRFPLAEVVRISLSVKKAVMVDKFTFRELGWDEKLYSGKAFPRIDFQAAVTLTTGETVRGHILGVLYIESGEDLEKFVLTKYLRGRVGQKIEDLVYVREVVFPARHTGKGGLVQGTLQGNRNPGKVFFEHGSGKLFLISHASSILAPVPLDPKGRFRAAHLRAGVYDFFWIADDRIVFHLSPPPDPGGPITADVRQALEKRVQEIEGFFTQKTIVHCAGGDKAVRVVVLMVRTEKSTYKKMKDPRFHRFDLWTLRKVGERWFVDTRVFLARGKDEKGGTASQRVLVPATSFGGIRVVAGETAKVTLTLPKKTKGS
jgi:hypothetical protein